MTRGKKPEYPWDHWLSRATGTLVVGRDFTCKASSFRSMLWTEGAARGLKVTTALQDNFLHYRVTPR